MRTSHDPHESCRLALQDAYAAAAKQAAIRQVVLRQADGTLVVLSILQVDMFQDGLRILVADYEPGVNPSSRIHSSR